MNIVNIGQYKEIRFILSPYIVIMLLIYSTDGFRRFLFIDKSDIFIYFIKKFVYFI